MAIIRMTYMGTFNFGGSALFCTDMSASIDVKPLVYDHVYGLTDVGSGDSKGGMPGSGAGHIQKKIYRWSPKLPKGNASGPVAADGGINALLKNAIAGGGGGNANFNFCSGAGASITDAVISNLTINATGGDVCSYSCEIVGMSLGGGGGATPPPCDQLLTWDMINVGVSAGSGAAAGVYSFSLTVSNPVIPIYTAGSNQSGDLYPKTLRIGMQEVSGSIGLNRSGGTIVGPGSVIFTLGGVGTGVRVVFPVASDNANTGRFISTLPFHGVSDGSVFF